ncbi:hypothetical protein EBS80_00335, partial [bacterium]|nr:hypothetical protein [bacterium]
MAIPYRDRFAEIIATAGGTVEDERYVTRPGVIVMNVTEPTLEAERLADVIGLDHDLDGNAWVAALDGRITYLSFPASDDRTGKEYLRAIVEDRGHTSVTARGYASVLFAGISLEDSIELIAGRAGRSARLTSSDTNAQNDTLYCLHGTPEQRAAQRAFVEAVLAIISEHSRRKLLEWHEMMHRYGIEVRGVPYPSQRWEDIPEDAERRLRDARGNALGVLVDNSELVVPGTEVAAARDHLRLVEHLCRATFYWFSADGTIARKTYEGRARGYLDLRDGEADGWWDDRFRMEGTGETPSAWRERTGSKVSARDHVIAQIIAEHVQTRPRDFQFSGIVPGRPVDFRRLVLDDLEEHPFYARESVRRFGLLGMFRHVANMGVHFRAP